VVWTDVLAPYPFLLWCQDLLPYHCLLTGAIREGRLVLSTEVAASIQVAVVLSDEVHCIPLKA
jgi:hypothetical protein